MADVDLLSLPESDFRNLLRKAAQDDRGAVTFPEDTQAAIDQSSAALPKLDRANYIGPEAAQMGARPDAFLDISTGGPASLRYDLGLDENRLNQFKVLARRYGAENVDMSPEGKWIARNQGNDGKTDIVIDPAGFEAGDLAQLGAQAGPIAAGVLGAKLGGRLSKTGIGKALSAATGAALAGETYGGLQDAAVRWFRGDEIGASDIAKQRAKQAIVDEALGIAAAGGAKMTAKAADVALGAIGIPMGESAQRTAANAIKQSTGVKYPLTPGQESGNKLLLRMEAGAASRPGSASAMDVTREAQQAAEDELKRIAMGLPRKMTDEELVQALPRTDETGSRALRRLGTYAERLESDVAQARQGVQSTATTEAQQVAGVDLTKPLSATDVGSTLRNRAVTEFNAGRTDFGQRYDAFLSKPEIQARTTAGDEIANAAKQVEKDFVPAAERSGQTEPVEAFVSAKFRGKLDALKDLKGANVSINDLKRIRTDLDNSIKEGIAIPGTDVAQLEALRGAVDDGITKALKGMPDKSLLTEWEGLKKDYSTFQGRFNRQGIRELLIPEGERGSVGNTAIAESITGNSPMAMDRYNAFKDFYGAASPEFKLLQQMSREQALAGSIPFGSDYVEGAALASRFQNMRPEIAKELFGTSGQQLSEISNILKRTQGRLDLAELSEAAQGGTLTAQRVQSLINAEEARAANFNNQLIKAASKGTLGAERIDPREFVRYATQMPEHEAMRVMNVLHDDPALVQDIKQLAIEDLWQRVQAGAPGQRLASSSLIDKALGDEAHQRTWRAILGDGTVDSLKELATVARNRDFAAQSYKGASQLSASSDVQRMFMKGEVGTLKEAASRFLVGTLYAGPLKRMVTNLANSQDAGRFLNAVVASTPFVEAVARRFGPEAPAVLRALGEQIEPLQRKELFIQGKLKEGDTSQLSLDEFKQWLKNSVQQ